MEPELETSTGPGQPASSGPEEKKLSAPAVDPQGGRELRGMEWALLGPDGLRVGWSLLLFAAIYYAFRLVAGTVFFSLGLISDTGNYSAGVILLEELVPFLALVGAMALMGLFESRRIVAYNLGASRLFLHLASGALAGFAVLSLLVGSLALGGWLHLASPSQPAAHAVQLALLWGGAFLFVGMVEEGLFRCYALFTLTRGINFWWSLAAQVVACLYLVFHGGGNGAWGVYLAAILGLIPCFILHQRRAAHSSFWQAAWVTSTVFGFYHTANNGENWIGIFAAASIGFVFCVSVRLTGSAWWAIGCHSAWDWAETFFYGTANSGLQGEGHLLTASPLGNPLWSGGDDGPEGSLLVLGVILVLLFILLLLYGHNKFATSSQPENRQLPA